MLIGMLIQICGAIGDEATHCDVRVKYDTDYKSVMLCDFTAEAGVTKLTEGMVKKDPKLVIYSESGKCYTQEGLKVKLNDLPDFMDAMGRTYQMSFY